ncbi:MAG: hypothetical protein JXB13_22790 [Phycisphaerae bacterium]|nr:hypothetical protein [Phycisphaerae bacterium]
MNDRTRSRMTFAWASGALWLGLVHTAFGLAAEEHRIVDKECGVEAVLPAADWKLLDASQGPAIVHIYSPATPPVPRFTLLRFPSAALPEGLKSRAAQLHAMLSVDVAVAAGQLAGAPAERIEYLAQGVRTVEYGLKRDEAFVIVQVAALEADWADEARRAPIERIFASVRFAGSPTTMPAVRIDPATPAEVRAARQSSEPPAAQYAIRSHDVRVTIDPTEHRLRCTDRFTVEAFADDVRELSLHQGPIATDAITFDGRPCPWHKEADDTLRIELPAPLARGQSIPLEYSAHTDDYFYALPQTLVAEVEMLGQVRPQSTFSSHVYYYPVDDRNDASMVLSLDVPQGFTAVSGGEPGDVATQDQRTIYRYEMPERRSRLLPLGFAVGDYRQISARTPSGLELVVYYFAGADAAAQQRLDIAVRAGTLFERQMGPLPWRRVAFCHVRPERKETGVSLPGLVLVSEGFFGDIAGVRLRGAGLGDPRVLGALVMVDELAHQWNAYATPLPNELAEGISTLSNLLYIEDVEGSEEYLAGMRYCTQAYLQGMALAGDVALAHPKLYESPCYRTVAFTKPPAVLHMLRRRMGDDAFFRAWRDAFSSIRERTNAYEAVGRSFQRAGGADLRRFFDDWFFRAGCPKIAVEWSNEPAGKGAKLKLTIRQVQEEDYYETDLDVAIEMEDGQTLRRPAALRAKETPLSFDLPSPARHVRLDPDEVAPIRLVEPPPPTTAPAASESDPETEAGSGGA